MFTGLKKNVAVFALSALAAGAVVIACSGGGGGGSNGGSGGETGGGGGDAAGKGGSATGGKGSGGSGNGGSGIGGNGGGGSGSGGAQMTGGMVGAGGTQMSSQACTPLDTNKGGIIGPTRVWAGPNILNAPTYKKETISEMEVWIPGQYEGAADGKVGIMFFSGAMKDSKLQSTAEKLIAAGMMPPTIMAFDGINWGEPTDSAGSNAMARAGVLAGKITDIKAKYPKLSSDPKMHGVAGQSTAGAVAFDLAWARPDVFGKVLGASASFAAFQRWLYPYAAKVDASKKDKIRVAFDVGECDLVYVDALIPAACQNICKTQMCICSGCDEGNWVMFNKEFVAKLTSSGYKAQLVIRSVGVHNTWTATVADDLAFLWRDVVCP